MSPARYPLLWPTVTAVGLHVMVAAWSLGTPTTSTGNPRPTTTTTTTVTTMIVSSAGPASVSAGQQSDGPTPTAVELGASRTADASRSEAGSEALPRDVVKDRGSGLARLDDERQTQTPAHNVVDGDLDFHPQHVTRAPYLAGEPIIDLAEDGAEMSDGSLELQLSIDKNGQVTERKVQSMSGLSDRSAVILERTFSGFEFVPAQRNGISVESIVKLTITVQAGQASTTEAR